MTKELKDLWLLAAWATFALACTFFAGAWHAQTYVVVR